MGGQPRRPEEQRVAARVGDPFVAALVGGGAGLSSRVVIEDVTPQVDGGR